MSSQPDADPWKDIEDEALAVFSGLASAKSAGLTESLRRAAHYALIDADASEIVITKRAFLEGFLSYGQPYQRPNTARWIAQWLSVRGAGALFSNLASGVNSVDRLASARASGAKVVASASMRAVGQLACAFAERTVGRQTGDLRHFFAAFLSDRAKAIEVFAELGWTPSAADMAAMANELFERISANPEPGENLDVWAKLLKSDPAASGDAKPRPRQIAGFTSDLTAAASKSGDPLQLMPDVQAFARLICLEEAQPPLSIGLFGGWGSGKSTFMQNLEHEIDALTADARAVAAADPAQAGAEPRFIHNAVQIRFNAWHFADANLWASLTAEFFDQLRAGGYAKSGKAVHTRLVERVNAYVHSLTADADTARQALLASEAAVRSAQMVRDEAAAQVDKVPGRMLRQTIVDEVTKSFEKHKGDLAEMGQKFDFDDPDKDIGDFIKLAKSLQTAGGQLAALKDFVFARGWRAILAAAGAALTAAGLAGMWAAHQSAVAQTLNALNVFTFIAGAGAMARAVMPGLKIISGLINSTSGFASQIEGELLKEVEAVSRAEESLKRATAEAAARRASAERAAKSLARYVDPNSAVANPPRLLRFLLEDNPDTMALENEIGIISRVRRLFQAVDSIVQDERDKAEGGDPDVPDRIVIYIDDLDRCTPAQVYAVLQAIHLLLAFRLFVVVVGVDVGWVQEALAHELRPNFANGQQAKHPGAADLDERKLAIRYLEKIFQLPFWLRRLSSEGDGGGSYGRFVRSLLAENAPAPPESGHGGTSAPGGQPPQSTPEAQGANTSDAAADIGKEPDSGAAAKTAEAVREALETVRLTAAEIDFLACEAIGNLAGTEPRTIKRFTNIYRIIRARLSEAERSLFLGEGGIPPAFPLVAVMIAVETGQPIEAADAFYESLAAQGEELLPDSATGAAIAAALLGAQKVRGNVPATHADCLIWARMARRYSFNKFA